MPCAEKLEDFSEEDLAIVREFWRNKNVYTSAHELTTEARAFIETAAAKYSENAIHKALLLSAQEHKRTPMNPIDYKELLKKYIAHIIGEESTDFMGRSLDNNEHLTNEEVVELRRLSKEVDS